MTQTLNKCNFSTIFEKENGNDTKVALFFQDILRYYFAINKTLLENKPFKLRDLQEWIVLNNKEIVEEYQDSKGHTSIANMVHAKEGKINRIFEGVIHLDLVKQDQTAKNGPNSLYTKKLEYVYTKSGILLILFIRHMHLRNELAIVRDAGKMKVKSNEFETTNLAIYELLDSTLPTGDDYPSSNIFYKRFYKKIKGKGLFYKMVIYITRICQSSTAENMEQVLIEYYIRDFAFDNKSDRKQFFDIWCETLEELEPEVKKLFLYQQKLLTQRRFEYNAGYSSREYERQRINHGADHEKVVLEGSCEKCKKQNILICSYVDYRKRYATLDDDGLIRFDCQECETKESLVIPSF